MGVTWPKIPCAKPAPPSAGRHSHTNETIAENDPRSVWLRISAQTSGHPDETLIRGAMKKFYFQAEQWWPQPVEIFLPSSVERAIRKTSRRRAVRKHCGCA
jgi:hypothetical protein